MEIDMSPSAVEGRLKDLDQLWHLCATLSTARRLTPEEIAAEKAALANPNSVTSDERRTTIDR